MDKLEQILQDQRPAAWEQFPDLDLYMDQLLSYVNRQQIFGDPETGLTKSMVNNYIKQEIIPRPNGKRYNREHIAELNMLMVLKEVLPIQLCQVLFEELDLHTETAKGYGLFEDQLDQALTAVAGMLDTEPDAQAALRFALLSYASRRVAMALLQKD